MIYLPPVLWSECMDEFGIKELDRRLLHGGLPEPLMSEKKEASFFSEWMDSFYARDIQELFGIRNRTGFMKLLHLLLRQSGGLLDYSHLAQLSDLSRHTVKAHVEAMSIAHAVHLLSPFQGVGRREITRRPPNAIALIRVLSPLSEVGTAFVKMTAVFYGSIWRLTPCAQ
jgi:predicted AAA+ superfamily ATPase